MRRGPAVGFATIGSVTKPEANRGRPGLDRTDYAADLNRTDYAADPDTYQRLDRFDGCCDAHLL